MIWLTTSNRFLLCRTAPSFWGQGPLEQTARGGTALNGSFLRSLTISIPLIRNEERSYHEEVCNRRSRYQPHGIDRMRLRRRGYARDPDVVRERDQYDSYLERMHLPALKAIDSGWPTIIKASYGDFVIQIQHPEDVTLPAGLGFAYARACRGGRDVELTSPTDWHVRKAAPWKVPDEKSITGMVDNGTYYWISQTYAVPEGYSEISTEPVPFSRQSGCTAQHYLLLLQPRNPLRRLPGTNAG